MNLALILTLIVHPLAGLDTATFAGGCFWSMEHPFDELEGVTSVTVGFMGGNVKHPSYQDVVTGRSGHRESVQIVYDPAKVSYEMLLSGFWHNIDPFQTDGQACDTGAQYHTAIFVRGDAQLRAATASRQQIMDRFKRDVATEILKADKFYKAEEYHQHYAKKNPIDYGVYRASCGRDRRLRAIWGDDAGRVTAAGGP
jgi:peptide-methionine (S)-S-oxide reductase